ncbi:MAG: hypothetical protein ACRC2A_06495 [Enterobacterales bacterium]|uniref:hypothetical protein n=1 Tax=Serratia sp. (in: enterobacteria) TaxID=616 RepID=UPI003F3A3221
MVSRTAKIKTLELSNHIVSAEGSASVIEGPNGFSATAITPLGKSINVSKSELFAAMVRAAPALTKVNSLSEPEGVYNALRYPEVKA